MIYIIYYGGCLVRYLLWWLYMRLKIYNRVQGVIDFKGFCCNFDYECFKGKFILDIYLNFLI